MRTILLFAEADSEIGFGHLGEIRAISRALTARDDIRTRVFAVGTPCDTGSDMACDWLTDSTGVIQVMNSIEADATVWSFRRPLAPGVWEALETSCAFKVWLADMPERIPHVDLFIMPTLVKEWQRHPHEAKSALLGPSYMTLDPVFEAEPEPIHGRTRDVLLSLGGADRSHATLRVLRALEGLSATVVIGPGFNHDQEVRRLASALRINVEEKPSGLRPLLICHRIVISAGGNTLCEAAASGTPALVAWEDPHERAAGTALEEAGGALVLGQGIALQPDKVREEIDRALRTPGLLDSMARAGRRLIDGKGAHRVVDAIRERMMAAV